MNSMELERVIEQNGEIFCTICKNRFNWEFKFDLLHGTETDISGLGKTTVVLDKPSNHVTFLVDVNNKIRFLITCPKCRCTHQTEPMNLKK